MSNPTQLVHVYDMPLRVIAGLSTLKKKNEDDLETGIVVSEVGEQRIINHPAWKDPLPVYQLRAARRNKIPDFIFGRCDLGNAFSAFLPRRFAAPAVGTKIVIDPVVTKMQMNMITMFNFIQADFYWIVHVPAPLGTGIYLKVYAPEIDGTTVTRGIRFKPSGQPTVALSLPWSNDLSLVDRLKGRPGQSGGSIVIETIEDNSTETVNSPLQITVWCCVANVRLTGLDEPSTVGQDCPGLNFQPVEPPKVFGQEEADNEVSGEGGILASDLIIDQTAVPLAPIAEQEAEEPEGPAEKIATRKNDTGHLATKWYEYAKINISAPTNLAWSTLTIKPYKDVKLSTRGESMVLPWRRNVWTTGSKHLGYITSLVTQVNIPRPPQISGVLEIKDSQNASSISLVEFGSRVDTALVPTRFCGRLDGITKQRPRYWLNPWLRTNDSEVQIHYRIIAFNRTSDVADLNVNIMLRPGYSKFQLPMKPTNNVDSKHLDLIDLIMDEYNQMAINGEEQSLPELEPKELPSPNQFITPMTAETPEEYNLHSELGEDEDLELDEFPVLVFKGNVPVDQVTSIQLDLPRLFDKAWDGEDNAISQKFKRFAHLIPKSAGGFGPVVGNYTITANLPTGVAGRIVHNCLPGDCVDLAVSRIFGLSSLLGLAGSAVSAIGGPILNGLVNTAAPILSGAAHAIGGNVVGGLADAAIGVASNVLTPGQKAQPSANSNAISGDIPISRFVEMIKYIKTNYDKDPVFPTLLIEPQNFINNAMEVIKNIPIEVFANMRNVKVERNLFDRSVVPVVDTRTVYDMVIPHEFNVPIMLDFLNNRKSFMNGTLQNIRFKQFLSMFETRKAREYFTLQEIINAPIDDNEDVAQTIGRVKRCLRQNLDRETTDEFSSTETFRHIVEGRERSETIFPSVSKKDTRYSVARDGQRQ